MSMLKRFFAAAFALLLAVNQAGAGSSTLSVTPGTGATYAVGTNGSSNFFGMFGICDGAACANLAGVSSTGALAVGPIQWAGGTLGAMANYGTSPGAVLVPGVNADVTNVNANGSATSANSSPVVIASDQAPVHSSLDPCSYSKKSTAFFNITASGASFITATAADFTYICQITVTASTQTNFSIVAGTGSSVCTGGTPYPIFGNPAETAANGALIGVSATVGGGIVVGNGEATVAGGSVGGTVNYNLCALITTTNSPTVNGTILYVQTAS